MSTVECPSCCSAAKFRFAARDWNRCLSGETFRYHECGQCGLIFLSPVPADLGRFYPSDYYPVPADREELALRSSDEQYKIEAIREHLQSGKLLEIGGSYGAFAFLAKKAGFDVDVIEMDGRCCSFLREVAGVRAVHESDPVAGLERQGQYDAIALWQVIEHLPDPWRLLPVIAQHLSPGGFLFVAAPNPESLQFKVQGARWPHVDAPRHLTLIPMALLKQRCEEAGLTLRSARTDDGGSLHWNRFGWEMWLATRGQSPLPRRMLAKAGRAINRIAAPLERDGLRGSTYTLVFQNGPGQRAAGATQTSP